MKGSVSKLDENSYTAIGWSSGDVIIILSIISIKIANKNYNWSQPEILRLLWDIIVFILVAYLLNMICLNLLLLYTKLYIYEFSYTILTHIYINFPWQVSFNAWDSQVSAYTPISFFMYNPFKLNHFWSTLYNLLTNLLWFYRIKWMDEWICIEGNTEQGSIYWYY